MGKYGYKKKSENGLQVYPNCCPIKSIFSLRELLEVCSFTVTNLMKKLSIVTQGHYVTFKNTLARVFGEKERDIHLPEFLVDHYEALKIFERREDERRRNFFKPRGKKLEGIVFLLAGIHLPFAAILSRTSTLLVRAPKM